VQGYIWTGLDYGGADLDTLKDEKYTSITMYVCIASMIIALILPIARSLENIDVRLRYYIAAFSSVLFLSGIFVLNQQLSVPKLLRKSNNIYLRYFLNFVLFIVLPIIVIPQWANGEMVVAKSDNYYDKVLLIFLFCFGVLFLADMISTGARATISLEDNNAADTDKDDLDYDSKITYCLMNTNLDPEHRLRQHIIKSNFIKFTRLESIQERLNEGRFTKEKTEFEPFFNELIELYFMQLKEEHNWPEKEKQPLKDFLDTKLMQSIVSNSLIHRLFKIIKMNWGDGFIQPQSVFSITTLLDFNYSNNSRDGIIKSVRENRSIVNYFVYPEQKFGTAKDVHYNRVRIFTAVFISYFDYLSQFQVPILSRKDDSEILMQILNSLTKKQTEKYSRTDVENFFLLNADYRPISLVNQEQDERLKLYFDNTIRQLMDSNVLYRSQSPVDEHISKHVDTDDITNILAKWDEWS